MIYYSEPEFPKRPPDRDGLSFSRSGCRRPGEQGDLAGSLRALKDAPSLVGKTASDLTERCSPGERDLVVSPAPLPRALRDYGRNWLIFARSWRGLKGFAT